MRGIFHLLNFALRRFICAIRWIYA